MVKERSKTVILVKNLPFSTCETELRDTFSKYGDLGRVVLPPAGITALVEFLEASEARKAFTTLAYTKVGMQLNIVNSLCFIVKTELQN